MKGIQEQNQTEAMTITAGVKSNRKRKQPKEIKIVTLSEQIKTLYKKGVRRFYVGYAVGVDTWEAEIIIDLKLQTDFAGIELFCAIPFPEQDGKFTEKQKKRYQNILKNCTDQKIISNFYSPDVYKRRNYFMIDRAQYLIAVYDQDRSIRSGTGQTVNYSIKKRLKMIFIHPDTSYVSYPI